MINEENIEDKVMQSIKDSGFNNSIIFLVQSAAVANKDKLEINAVAACTGDMDILHECLCKLLEKDDKMYKFFSESLEIARKSRNKTNPNVN